MFKKLRKTFVPDNKSTEEVDKTPSITIHKLPEAGEQKSGYETIVVSEETVELFEHRMTHWENDIIKSDIRRLMARPSDGSVNQKIVVTEKISIPEQSLMVPIKVNKKIGGKDLEGSIVSVPVRIKQLDVPVIETLEVIDVPIRSSKRTTQLKGPIDQSVSQIQ